MHSFDPDDDDAPEVGDAPDGVPRPAGAGVARAVAAARRRLDAARAHLARREDRPEQDTLVEVVAAAIAAQRSVIIEAGTGVGKSLAYLAAAADAGCRAVVVTATKNLQDQLADRDAPLVAATAPRWTTAVLKGRSNYVCRMRLRADVADQLPLEAGEDLPRSASAQVRRIQAWLRASSTGDLDELAFELDGRVRRAITVTPAECLGRAACPQGSACYAELARDRAGAADLVIVNAHLYLAHLAVGAGILPDHDLVIIDEAHEFPEIAAELLGASVSPGRLRAVAAAARAVLGPVAVVDAVAGVAERLQDALRARVAVVRRTDLDEGLTQLLAVARESATRLASALRESPEAGERANARFRRAAGPLTQLLVDLRRLVAPGDGDVAYLTERERDVTVDLAVVDPGPLLAGTLWPGVTGVLVSATIPDGLPRAVGLPACEVVRIASPFDYRHHALLYVPPDLPARTEPGAEEAITDELVTLISAAGGRTLALFTNRGVMARVAAAVADRIETPVLVQGRLSRDRLIRRFRDEPETSLFAVTSFWQGVDVPGRSLHLVTIDRLPFGVPTDPLAAARRQRADHPFVEVDLPRATMLLAQGVGRLIRSTTDRGVVAVLDTRLADAPYRAHFFRRLPPMRRTRDRDQVISFLTGLDRDPD
ncbi:MAG: ATP-dependent DNA helicase [Acidimicrobiales bacterium]